MASANISDSDDNALLQSLRLQDSVSARGFDWPDVGGVLDKLAEEVDELREALHQQDADAIAHELGDIFLVTVNLCRFVKQNPNSVLLKANARFENRFRKLDEALVQSGQSMETCTLDELDRIWSAVKSGADKELRDGS